MNLSTLKVFDKLHLRPIIPVWKRPKAGKNYAKVLRSGGAIPGILYGCNQSPINIAMPQNEMIRYFNRYPINLECTLFDIMIDNRKEIALPRDLCCDPVTEIPISVNFLRHDPEKGSRVWIPIRYYNLEKSDDIRQYGYIYNIHRYLECYAYGDYIPEYVMCDMTGFKIGQHIRTKDLELPDNIDPVDKYCKMTVGIVKKNIAKYKKLTDPKVATTPAAAAAAGKGGKGGKTAVAVTPAATTATPTGKAGKPAASATKAPSTAKAAAPVAKPKKK